jgi:RNA polymerase sigma factor (sigma-70 family)
MSARAQRTDRRDRSQEILDDEQQQALLDQAHAGSAECHEALWKSQLRWLMPWAEHNLPKALRSKYDANDLLQDVSFHAWRGWPKCRSVTIAEFRGWLAEIAKHCLSDAIGHEVTAQCREAAREERLDERAIEHDEQRPWNRAAALAEDIALFIEADDFHHWAASLPAEQWTVFVSLRCDGRSAEELARELGCSPRTVQRVCQAMDEALDRHVHGLGASP